jgi:hypothetical protein
MRAFVTLWPGFEEVVCCLLEFHGKSPEKAWLLEEADIPFYFPIRCHTSRFLFSLLYFGCA